MVYPNDEVFTVGKAKVVRKSDSDQVLVVAAGVTLHEAIKAADTLAEKVADTPKCNNHIVNSIVYSNKYSVTGLTPM